MTSHEEVIGDLLFAAAERHGDQPWIIFGGTSYTFAEAKQRALMSAGAFLDAGISRGDRVVFVARNSPELVFQWLGLALVGGIFVALNPDAPSSEVVQPVDRAEPKRVIVGPTAVSAPQLLERRDSGELRDFITGARPTKLPTVSGDDLVTFIATSGSTGESKMVMQTQRAYVLTAQAFPWWLGIRETDRMMTSLPLFHLNAQVYSTLGSLASGTQLILLDRFSASDFWEVAVATGATQVNMIGAMLEILMRQTPGPLERAHKVRLIYTAPAPSKSRHQEIEARFGVDLIIGYGLSESPYGTIWPIDEKPYESMGRLRQHPAFGEINRGRIVDDEGNDVSPGEVGELLLNNPATMAGYFGMEEETNAVLGDGWLKTGDLVRQDADGFYHFVSRRKHIIRRRGENLSATEVERVLEESPLVIEAAVIGVPSEFSDEDVKAFIVSSDSSESVAIDLHRWCLGRLARFKVPRFWEFVDDLPHTPTNRVAKHKLARHLTGLEFDSSTWTQPQPSAGSNT